MAAAAASLRLDLAHIEASLPTGKDDAAQKARRTELFKQFVRPVECNVLGVVSHPAAHYLSDSPAVIELVGFHLP
jgi:hypothetical protein